MKRLIFSGLLSALFVGVIVAAFQADAQAQSRTEVELKVSEYFAVGCNHHDGVPECDKYREALKTMLKIAGPYPADPESAASPNDAKVGDKYCTHPTGYKVNLHTCTEGGWGGLYLDRCPSGVAEVFGLPRCPNRSGIASEFEVTEKLADYFDFGCSNQGDDNLFCRDARGALQRMLKID